MHIPYEEGHVDQDCSEDVKKVTAEGYTRISFQIQQEVEIRCHFSRVKNRIMEFLNSFSDQKTISPKALQLRNKIK